MANKEYDSWVLFELESDFKGAVYRKYVFSIMSLFFRWSDNALNNFEIELLSKNGNRWNQEGGIENLCIIGKEFTNCKMHYFDDTEETFPVRSILFRNYYDDHTLEMVFLIADAFEEFLKVNNIPHKRQNRKKRN